ncbi:hypothetical protein BUME_01850 [[Butyribacterium] methylotrophicum]|nr:hypothetical protein [Eubacterium callanderi]MCG4817517.1 hypothetical protein [Eubacterium callanderi]MCQ5187854.1 hypothetical protein [Eubacterium callanderi]OEZ06593.1 hypothetical protein BUME_01850 [[Butyribacterium] methylotrophicum]WPK84174.1 hypothetical protein EUCAMar_17130 [Eubacterium callanderi]
MDSELRAAVIVSGIDLFIAYVVFPGLGNFDHKVPHKGGDLDIAGFVIDCDQHDGVGAVTFNIIAAIETENSNIGNILVQLLVNMELA